MTVSRVHLYVSGRVQGVFFRQSTKQEADRLGLAGWVRNLDDGRVEAMAQGPREALDAFVAWCRKGPTHAKVTDVAIEWSEASEELVAFTVRR